MTNFIAINPPRPSAYVIFQKNCVSLFMALSALSLVHLPHQAHAQQGKKPILVRTSDGLTPKSISPEGIVGVIAEDAPITLYEAQSLPPACWLVFAHMGEGSQWYLRLKDSPLLDKSENLIARNAISYHHVCWAEVARARYYRAKDAATKKKHMLSVAGNYTFMTQHPEYVPPNWPYMSEMYIQEGNARANLGEDRKAITAYFRALDMAPDNAHVYVALSSYMENRGAKAKALEYATEGLKRAPNSKSLQKRYLRLGGNKPFPAPLPALAKPEQSATPAPAVPISAPPENIQAPPQNAPSLAPTQPAGDNAKPHCRFCP